MTSIRTIRAHNTATSISGLGRPGLKLTDEQLAVIASLAKHGCSIRIIADSLGLDHATLADNVAFVDTYKKHYAQACSRVHHRQFELLESSNDMVATTNAIWLGKQLLGQVDRAADTGPRDIRIEISFVDRRQQLQLQQPGLVEGEAVEGEARELTEGQPGSSFT